MFALIYLTKVTIMTRNDSRQAGAREEVEITREMVEAGVTRLSDLLEAGTGSAYVVEEVFQAMLKARREGAQR